MRGHRPYSEHCHIKVRLTMFSMAPARKKFRFGLILFEMMSHQFCSSIKLKRLPSENKKDKTHLKIVHFWENSPLDKPIP